MTDIVCSGALFYAKDTKRFMLVQRANKKHQQTKSSTERS